MLLADIGLAIALVVLALFLIWRLYDLFRAEGRWAEEMAEERTSAALEDVEETRRRLEELNRGLEGLS